MEKITASFQQEKLEPLIPLLLGIHGNLMLFTNQSQNYLAYIIVNSVLIVGLLGFVYKKYTSRFMLGKYLFFNGAALVLIYIDGGVGSFFTIWLFLLALYVLYLEDRSAIIFGILIPIFYGLIAPFSTVKLSNMVVIQRSVVLMVISLIAFSMNRNLIQIALEKERAQQNILLLERSNSDLEQFALAASHDLKTPLLKIIQSIDFIEGNYGNEMDPEVKTLIEISKNSSEQLNKLITDMLSFSKVTIDEKAFEKLQANDVLNVAIQNLSEVAKNRNAEIEVSDLPYIWAIRSLMISLFQNIIHNAIKFNTSEKPKVKISCSNENEKEVLFSIEDNGIGIGNESKDKLFSLFQRAGNDNIYPGTGVGLALCKRIVEIHKGDIWFESNKSKGTTFFVKLPKNISGTI